MPGVPVYSVPMTFSTFCPPWKLKVFWSSMTVSVACRSRSAPGTFVVPHAQPTSGWPAES